MKDRPDCFCDDCMRERLCLAWRQEVAPFTKALGLTAGFSPVRGLCPFYSHPRVKYVIVAL